MTLTIPTLALKTSKIAIQTAVTLDRKIQEIQASLFWEIFTWILYVFVPFWTLLLILTTTFVHDMIMVPTYAWNLLWHLDGRSIYAMLRDPEGKGSYGDHRLPRRKFRKHVTTDDNNNPVKNGATANGATLVAQIAQENGVEASVI